MRKKLYCLLVVSLFFLTNGYSQKYDKVDLIVDNYPKTITTADQLVALVLKDFTLPDEKARAIFRWVCTSVAYDVVLSESMNHSSIKAFSYKTEKEKEIKEKKFKQDLIQNTMITKKAVCHGYAVLIEYLYLKLGLETKIILGNLRTDVSQIGKLPEELNHAWNVVKIDNKWQFVDATLASGFVSAKTNLFKFYFNEGYFFTSPEKFFLNHYPLDEKWLFVAKNKSDFAKLPVFFGAFFENTYNIVKPESGICMSKKSNELHFSISGLSENDVIQYLASSDNKKRYLKLENQSNFSIPIQGNENTILYLFINGKVIAMYKIV
ncbi:transglutaminase domain-containing protein [Flavobacterium sp. NG2]|uniref:transglutaminase domain-containing protein n=1 Tax=Flavobacterium sp. NG2 TaxID=3097547 RepID=UPI002A81CB84|nr:transglutaminase domain-containing protein [Flavobacterium sp. NG2]WPR70923.1 transglutaminase domain-containing protein [Flavobacterium sp. NG2]